MFVLAGLWGLLWALGIIEWSSRYVWIPPAVALVLLGLLLLFGRSRRG